jgi:hypothetical protein
MRRVRTGGAATHGAAGRPGASCRRFREAGAVACPLQIQPAMSQKSVEVIIGRLATDEALRTRFIADPAGTLRSLREEGLDLNPTEVDALLKIPNDLWTIMARWVHPRLQKIALRGDCHES